MDGIKKTACEADKTVREAGREVDGHDVRDDVGNLGDEVRTRVGNAGDDIRKAADNVKREADRHQPR